MSSEETQLSLSLPKPTYVVLTPLAIHAFPKMLAVSSPLFKLVVPRKYAESALFDLLSNKKKDSDPSRLRPLFEKATEAKIVEVKDIKYAPNDGAENLAVNLARKLAEEGYPIILVVAESETRKYGKMIDKFSIIHSIEILEVKQFRHLLNSSESMVHQDLLQLAKEFNLYKYRDLNLRRWPAFVEPLVIMVVMLVVLSIPRTLVGFLFKLNTWLAVSIVIAFSTFLFWYRAKYRFYYGILETAFGIIIASSVIYFNLDYTKLLAIDYITLVSGIYVIIRGLDNVERGLPYIDFDGFKDWWEKVFEPPKPRI
jgi:hypothetical protein